MKSQDCNETLHRTTTLCPALAGFCRECYHPPTVSRAPSKPHGKDYNHGTTKQSHFHGRMLRCFMSRTRCTPIQVVLIRDPHDRRSEGYVRTLREALTGGEDALRPGYLSGGLDLGIPVLVPQDPVGNRLSEEDCARLLGGARHTVVVEIMPHDITEERRAKIQALTSALEKGTSCEMLRHAIRGPIADDKGKQIDQYGPNEIERELAPTGVALHAIDRVRSWLHQECLNSRAKERAGADKNGSAKKNGASDEGVEKQPSRMTLFLSHAKLDGIPTALSLINLIERLREPRQETTSTEGNHAYFYDVISIQPGDYWVEKLNEAATNSVLIALRTDEYENRYWCREEYLGAEENGMPILAVDLRTELVQAPEQLPFGCAPTVRVTDGNLIRVLFFALGLHVRTLRTEVVARQRVNDPLCVLPRRPSEVSWQKVKQDLGDKPKGVAIYPAPLTGSEEWRKRSNDDFRLVTLGEL